MAQYHCAEFIMKKFTEQLAYEAVRLEVTMGDNPYKADDFPMYVAKRNAVARQKKGTAIMAIPAAISSPATTFLMLILFTLLSCSALSVGLISTFILCYNCCRFHPVICFSFFLRSAQVCIHSLCVLKVKLGIQFTLP